MIAEKEKIRQQPFRIRLANQQIVNRVWNTKVSTKKHKRKKARISSNLVCSNQNLYFMGYKFAVTQLFQFSLPKFSLAFIF
jgi:aspartate carbamoyltransferase regulatory subunit